MLDGDVVFKIQEDTATRSTVLLLTIGAYGIRGETWEIDLRVRYRVGQVRFANAKYIKFIEAVNAFDGC